MHFMNKKLLLIVLNTYLLLTGLLADPELPLTEKQLQSLADDVCGDMFLQPQAATRCTKKFLYLPYKTDDEPPTVDVKHRGEKQLAFALPESKDSRLVIMVPEDEADMLPYFFFKLMEPTDEAGTIYTPPGPFTLWTTLVNDVGSHSSWRSSSILPAWKTVANVDPRPYLVNHTFLFDNYDNTTVYIDVQFTWNASNTNDASFDVYHRCNYDESTNVFHKVIRVGMNRSIIVSAPLDDKCMLLVKGNHGQTKFEYETPFCYDLPGCKYLPVKPKILTLMAEGDSISSTVTVKWETPRYPPSYYNVTLRADEIYSINVSKMSTEAIFTNVKGRGEYNVTVDAINDNGHAVSFQKNIFSPYEEPTPVSSMVGVWAEVIVILTIFITFSVWWKRRRDIKKRNIMYFPGVRGKALKDGDVDICSVDSGWEDQWEVKPDRLLIHEVIGEGAFGVVRRGTLAPDDKIVAVKMLKEIPSVEEIRSFRAEMELMKSVGSHPHVVSLLGCCRGRKPLIIAEYCSRGDLLTYLRCSWDLMVTRRNANYNNNEDYRDPKPKQDCRLVINRLYDLQGTELTVLDLLSFCRQIAMGMEFLASNRVVHRDLAARNVLVTEDRTLKIADFGLSRDVYEENQYKQKGNGKMPVKWMALESLTHRIYTTQSDVWSFGVVMWEIVTVGGTPYPSVGASRLPRLLRAGYRMPRPSNCSAQLYEIMLSCWHDRPRSRPTFTDLHRALDGLLLCASEHHYLDLELPPEPAIPRQAIQRYIRNWPWSNRYQRSQTTNYPARAN